MKGEDRLNNVQCQEEAVYTTTFFEDIDMNLSPTCAFAERVVIALVSKTLHTFIYDLRGCFFIAPISLNSWWSRAITTAIQAVSPK